MMFLMMFLMIVLQVLQALPQFSDVTNSSYALVLCGALDKAIGELRTHELSQHVVGAEWLEQDCVSIDVCKQLSSNRDPVFSQLMPAMAGVWLNVNSSALQFAGSAKRRADAESGVVADNVAALEWARIPEGLKVETCAVDYDLLRRTGRVACDEATMLKIEADDTVRSCPGDLSYSLVDCVKALQFDAGSQQLMRRPEHEKAHLGSLSRAEACAAPESALAAQVCLDLEQYSLVIPAAASHGTTSLVKYEFLPGYGCSGPEALAGSSDTVLSRMAAPNRVVACASVAHGKAVRRDAYTCGIDCDEGFRLQGGVCVSGCAGMNATCGTGYHAVETCQEGPTTMYLCEQCVPRAGHGAAVWRAEEANECQYQVCPAGTYSKGMQCVECEVNTFSNASGATACFSCDTLATGLYQRRTGQSACDACLWKEDETKCEPGAAAASSWQAVEHAFEGYNAHGHAVELRKFYDEYCTAGHACLPCAPGHYSKDGGPCAACTHGFYMPNIGASECYQCAQSQNTSQVASTRASDCVCVEGHE